MPAKQSEQTVTGLPVGRVCRGATDRTSTAFDSYVTACPDASTRCAGHNPGGTGSSIHTRHGTTTADVAAAGRDAHADGLWN